MNILNYKHFSKIYMGAVVAASTLYASTEMANAAVSIDGCTNKLWSVPDPVLKIKELFAEPVVWIQWVTGITLPFVLILIFLKIKSAKGRPEKIEDGMRALYWTLGIDLAIFSVTWAAGWYFGKIC
ncbi:hypothetical protein [Paenibacillus pasadenensis]|uniref:hypothetical protein n=1 Tax=Paenibacillus pasadenensis TaxID=217090 RepID=UPI0011AF94C7|nr:hypothetical protein [Paenibacillus pasadenensis]